MTKPALGLFIAMAFSTALSPSHLAHANEKQAGPEVRWSTGVDFTSGDYADSQNTSILYVPFSAKALFGDFEAKVTVPYIRIKGPGTVVGGGDIGPIARDRIANMITTQDGLGDVTASLTYTKFMQDNTLFVDFTGKVKLPTASAEKNLGTGLTDFTTQVDVTKSVGGVNLFATAGYRFMGSSDALVLRDGFLGSLGASFDVSDRTSLGLIYDYRQSASLRAENPSELTGFVSWKLSKKIRLQTYGIVGFSSGSPDTGVGMQISLRQ
ncbi:MAG: hypothetical protein JKY25_03800 [Robiginitomaculum sp.]|nr:hypothetical protein [Robiginitomaculum sp.]